MNAPLFRHWLCCSICGMAATVWAISPADALRMLQAGEPITFIDLRSNQLFQQGHIPNAINIPAALLPQKQLPPLGPVILYDSGLGPDAAQEAALAMNQRKGIQAEVLAGGYAAWQTAKSPTTESTGLKPEAMPMITYDQLKQAHSQGGELVLVDLRRAAPAPAEAGSKAAAQPLTDLQVEFPKAKVARSAPVSPGASKNTLAGDPNPPPLLVLIDKGDGSAQQTARALKANGFKRFVILAGGEDTLARKGQPGLQRIGSTMVIPRSAAPATNNNR